MAKISGSNKCLQILHNDVFDPLYSICFNMEDVSLTIRKELIQMLTQGLKNLLQMADRHQIVEWASMNFISSQSLHQMIREDSKFKMAVQI